MSKEDSRFAEVFNNPRFAVAPQKANKIAVDDRFKAMFGAKKDGVANDFNVVSRVDKYGRAISKDDAKHIYENYYKIETEE